MAVARVQPLTRTRAVRGLFDYRLAEGQRVEVGSVLRVPFGHRRELGVVVDLAAASELEPERLTEPEEVLDESLPADLVQLATWMAREYCSTSARALGLMLAPGAPGRQSARRVLVAELTEAGRAMLRAADGGHHGEILTQEQRQVLERLAGDGPLPAAELGTARLRRLERRGLAALDQRVTRRRPARHVVGSAPVSPPTLTGAQRRALDALLAALRAPAPGGQREPHLLHGVTGSGKTEVYLHAVEATLAAGRGAIVLVPEIALTPQALARFEARLGEVVAVLHSGLSAGQRRDEWVRLRRGEARVCVGPRSAVLAPVDDVGLIVVDEEHEGSYKHEGDPRYDARTVARERARAHGALLVLGSATPRPETVMGARRLRLAERADGRPLPPVQVLDMCGHHHPLHPVARLALADLRHYGGKAILLLNRRGWCNFLSCRACGRVWGCPNCDVALVLHRDGSTVACHHCGHRERVPDRCPDCASVSVARHGAGTERIEHELREALGGEGFEILRLDADSTGIAQRARTLERFHAARRGILIGTQMVAKGHDFPDVGLGVVVDADQTLRFPDFRAEERTFALITQLAGRIGRGADGGRVLVQTLAPEARALQFAARHDSEGFIADELTRRRALGYPPYTSLIRVVCTAPEAAPARLAAEEIARRLPALDADVLGPAPLFRLRGRFRSQLVIKARDRRGAIAAVGEAVDAVGPGAARRHGSVSVDVDPQ